MKIFQALDDSDILLKEITKTIKNETKRKQKGGFLSMILVTLASTLLGSMLPGKVVSRAGYGKQREGIVRAGYGSSIKRKLLFYLHHIL